MKDGTMPGGGLVKLTEECGELVQISMKMMAYPGTDDHPDGKGSMRQRLLEEVADVQACLLFVMENHGLSEEAMIARAQEKLGYYKLWHAGINTTPGYVNPQG